MLFTRQAIAPLLVVLALRTRYVASFSFSVTPPQECEPLNVSFNGSPSINDLPLTLTVIPADSTLPLSVSIPDTAVQNAGVSVSFLPYSAGTNVILSIDNISNQSVTSVSSVFQVLPSSTGNSSCLSTSTVDERYYTTPNSYTQCGPFNVTYNSTVVTHPPTIRMFLPGGPSFILNMTGAPTAGIATYEMSATFNSSVILLLDDHNGHRLTTPVIDVDGDSTSDSACVPTSLSQHQNATIPSAPSSSPTLSKLGFAVVAGVISGVVLVVLLLMAVYLYSERRRRRSIPIQNEDDYDHQSLDKGPSPPPMRPSRIGIPALFASRSTLNQSPKASLWSRYNDQPASMVSREAIASLERRPNTPSAYSDFSDLKEWDMVTEPPMVKLVYSRTPQLKRLSLTSMDIEDMLNSATIYNGKDDDVMSDSASVVSRVLPPISIGVAKRRSVVANPPPRRYNTRGQVLDRWSKKPDVPTDSYPRLSTASNFSGVVPPLPRGLLNGRSHPLSPLASIPSPQMRTHSPSADTGPTPPQTPWSGNTLSRLSWEGRDRDILVDGESGGNDGGRRFSRALGGVIQAGWYAM